MADKRAKIVITVVSVLGLLSVVAGFAAEATKITPSQITSTNSGECVYPRSAAFPLGLLSAFALLVADIIIFCETGHAVRGRGPCIPGSLYNIMFSSITFIVAFILLVYAAAVNYGGHGLYGVLLGTYDYYDCYVLKPCVFIVGALISLACVSSSLVYYIYLYPAKNALQVQHGIALVQVHPVRPAQDPALVA